MKQEIKIVIGAAFGDEGKGNTVQYLCKKAIEEGKKPLVIRYCGGAQAGHRVVHNGISHVCSSFGSGVLLGVPTYYIGNNYFIDPIAMINEYETLIEEGVENISFPIFPKTLSQFTTPYDILAGLEDKKVMSDGSCGMGIYKTYKRYIDFPIQRSLEEIAEYYNMERNIELEGKYNTAMCKINHLSKNYINLDDYDVLIFEGTQGLLLDMEHGFMPHCTPSKVGLNGVPQQFITPNTEVYLVTRTYLTRHGNGYEPKNTFRFIYFMDIPEEKSNFNDGHQGVFKTGAFDYNLLNRAFDRHCLDNYNVKYNLVLTHCDCCQNNFVYCTDNKLHEVHSISELLNLNFRNVLYFNSEEA